jgi:cobalt-zinc-cadmium efflux system membrane fusion protein
MTELTQAPTRRVSLWLRWSLALSLAAGVLFWSTRGRDDHAGATEGQPARDVPYLDGQWIRYSKGFAERIGLRFTVIEKGALAPVVHVTGTVEFDPDRVAAIGARIAGRVRTVLKLEGDRVARGDVLAEIESAELGEAQAALISARAHEKAALANEIRERALAKAMISSERDAELAAAVAASASADFASAENRVRAMGGRPNGEPGVLLLQSPLAGKVVTRNLSRGQFVEPTLTAFKVADLRRVFVTLAVFERDVSSIRPDDEVEIGAGSAAGPTLLGRVAYVGDEIDLQTKTAAVRVMVDQPDTPLRPGQSVAAKIRTHDQAREVLLVPRDAVTSVDGKPTVFVRHDEHSVEPRAIEIGRSDGKHDEVIEGLAAGERVVQTGVFALKSEIFR